MVFQKQHHYNFYLYFYFCSIKKVQLYILFLLFKYIGAGPDHPFCIPTTVHLNYVENILSVSCHLFMRQSVVSGSKSVLNTSEISPLLAMVKPHDL